MVNIVGQVQEESAEYVGSSDVTVHLYGKTPRPGRKLGHVTATAETTREAIGHALDAANKLEQEHKQETEKS
jgi:5-(carboxyamino)imidazole ribonucleotide synthase